MITSNFPSGAGGGGGGVTLAPCSNISTKVSHGKVYVKWTDPADVVVGGTTLATWGGTILVRKAGSAPVSRRDGTVVVDSKVRSQYQSSYFTDSGLTDGTTYYYKLFPYTTTGTYTDDPADEFNATPVAVKVGNVSNMSAVAAGNGKLAIEWTDPAATVVEDGITLATWGATKVVVKAGSYATDPDDADAAWSYNSTTRNAYASTPLTATGLTNGTTYYVTFFPTSTEGAVNTNTANRTSGTADRLVISAVPSQNGTLTYDGTTQVPTWDDYDSAKMTKSEVGQVNAGTYNTTSFTPKDDYKWSDGTIAAKAPDWTIDKVTPTVTAPTKASNTTYDGNAHALLATDGSTNYGTLQYKVNSGSWAATSPSETAAGDYAVSYRVVGDSNVNDVAAASVGTVTIAKKTGTLTVSKSTITLNASKLTDTFTIGGEHDGTVSVQSSDTTVATVSKSGNTVTVTSVNGKSGTVTVTVSVTSCTNYTTPSDKTVTVNAQFLPVAYTSAQAGVTYTNGLSGLTDAQISEIANGISNNSAINSNTSEVWVSVYNRHISIGDTISYTLSGTSYSFRVMGFNHYTLASATAYGSATTTGKAGILMQMVDCFNTTQKMKASMASTDGWHNSDLRTWMSGTMLGYFPSSAQNAIKQVNVSTAKDVSTATLNTTADKLFLPAEVEVFGSASYAKGGTNEGTRYAWYKANDTAANRVKKVNGSASYWWERSPYSWSGSYSYFCIVGSNGNTGGNNASYARGVAPCFNF